MFSWFLKLLGIEEDKPVSSDNAFSATNKPAPAATPEVKKAEAPKTQTEQTPAEEKSAPETIAKAESESESEAEPPSVNSLQDVYPGLKANFVKVLTEAGFKDKAAIDNAPDKDLLALKGIGQATLKILRGK